jgi:hypothetical protein
MRQGMCLPQAAHAAESHGRRHLQRNSTLACRAPHLKSLATPGNFLNTGLRLGAEPTQPVTRRTFRPDTIPGPDRASLWRPTTIPPSLTTTFSCQALPCPLLNTPRGPTRAPSTGRGLHSSQEPSRDPTGQAPGVLPRVL